MTLGSVVHFESLISLAPFPNAGRVFGSESQSYVTRGLTVGA